MLEDLVSLLGQDPESPEVQECLAYINEKDAVDRYWMTNRIKAFDIISIYRRRSRMNLSRDWGVRGYDKLLTSFAKMSFSEMQSTTIMLHTLDTPNRIFIVFVGEENTLLGVLSAPIGAA